MRSYDELVEIYCKRVPYVDVETLNGTVVVFDDDFIKKLDAVLDGGCVSEMGSKELELFHFFIEYEDGNNTSLYAEELDKWLVNMVNSIQNISYEGC